MNNTKQNLIELYNKLKNGEEVSEEVLEYYGLIEPEEAIEEHAQEFEIHGLNGNIDTYRKKYHHFLPMSLSQNKFKRCKGHFNAMYTIARKTDTPLNIQTTKKEGSKQIKFTPKIDKAA